MMTSSIRKFFIDGGAHVGESTRLFRDKYPNSATYKVIMFEPNPRQRHIFESQEFSDAEFHDEAIWVADGASQLYDHQSSRDYGTSLHPEMFLMKRSYSSVKCIDFSKWMLERFTRDDEIILKFDIEGSEYNVLPKMIEDGSIDLIDKLYIEWHVQFRPTITQEMHDKLIDELAKRNIPWHDWDAMVPQASI